jgi:hypothetical protein
MVSLTRMRPALATTLALAFALTACSDAPQTPRRLRAADGRLSNSLPTPTPTTVCKVGPPGTYTFNITGVTTGTFLVSLPFTLQAGECKDVYLGSPAIDLIHISETNLPTGTALDHIVAVPKASGDCSTDPRACTLTFTGTNTADIEVFDLGPFTVTFYNVCSNGNTTPDCSPPQVCTDQNATNFGGPLPCVYPGKTFTIGPSSMEGAIRIDAGDWVNGGYSFKFKSAHTATTFTVTSFVTITGPCRNSAGQLTGTTGVLTVPMGTKVYNIPASSNATDWLPTGDANNVLSWAGSIIAPASLCGGGGNSLDASKGAVYTATVSQTPPSGSLVDFRFKYRDPAAKGKPNTNCLDTTDPNRARADVCGASWSQTVTDP